MVLPHPACVVRENVSLARVLRLLAADTLAACWGQVNVKETRRTFLQFLTSVCAILGGVFALSGVVNNLMYRGGVLFTAAQQTRKRRNES